MPPHESNLLRDFCEIDLLSHLLWLLTNLLSVLSMVTHASDLQIRRSWDDNGVAIWDKYVIYPALCVCTKVDDTNSRAVHHNPT
jgi:hypothetical protein